MSRLASPVRRTGFVLALAALLTTGCRSFPCPPPKPLQPGAIHAEVRQERVDLLGKAVTVLRGELVG